MKKKKNIPQSKQTENRLLEESVKRRETKMPRHKKSSKHKISKHKIYEYLSEEE